MIIDGVNYYSQFFQDYLLNKEIFKNKMNGTFIEFGAWDGVDKSNTYFFEKHLNWSGLCIEPIPDVYDKLVLNRSCECLWGAVVPDNRDKATFMLNSGSGMNSGVKGLVEESRLKIYNTIEVPAYNINSLLNNFNEIDYLSIDIDGSEFDIIKNINFDNHKINVISVENMDNDRVCYDFLLTKGYKYNHRIFIDDIYVRLI